MNVFGAVNVISYVAALVPQPRGDAVDARGGGRRQLHRRSRAPWRVSDMGEIKIERLKALIAFKKDSMTGKFPGKKQSSNLEKKQFEKFLDQLD